MHLLSDIKAQFIMKGSLSGLFFFLQATSEKNHSPKSQIDLQQSSEYSCF